MVLVAFSPDLLSVHIQTDLCLEKLKAVFKPYLCQHQGTGVQNTIKLVTAIIRQSRESSVHLQDAGLT
jgi:hypothetical protein